VFERVIIVLYSIGIFALNFAVAVILPKVIIDSMHIRSDWDTLTGILHAEAIAAAIAFVAGYVVEKIWHPRGARWIWIVGWVWLVWVSFMYQREHASMNILEGPGRHSIWWMMSGDVCASDRGECGYWYLAILPLFRTNAYSLAAWLCVRFHGKPATQVDSVRVLNDSLSEMRAAQEQLPASRKTLLGIGTWIFLAGETLIALRFSIEPKWKLYVAGQLIMPAGLFIIALAEKGRWMRLLLCVLAVWVLFGAWKTLHMSAAQRLTFH
jgi:hypothetical protein